MISAVGHLFRLARAGFVFAREGVLALADPAALPAEWLPPESRSEEEAVRARRIGNFIAGMTDRFALTEHQRLFDSTPDLR